jgi:hypothetical protein
VRLVLEVRFGTLVITVGLARQTLGEFGVVGGGLAEFLGAVGRVQSRRRVARIALVSLSLGLCQGSPT